MTLRALILDSDPRFSRELEEFLTHRHEDNRHLLHGQDLKVHVLGRFTLRAAGMEAIRHFRPDAVFVESSSQTFGGPEALRAVAGGATPLFVLTSLDPRHALRAFESGAADFLLRPLTSERVQLCLRKVAARLQNGMPRAVPATNGAAHRADLVPHATASVHQGGNGRTERLVFKSRGRIVFVPMDAIEWIGSEGNYVRIHANGESHLLRETMNGIESRLDKERFLRIHRCAIVNIAKIKELRPFGQSGEAVVLLENETRLNLGPSFKERVANLLTQ